MLPLPRALAPSRPPSLAPSLPPPLPPSLPPSLLRCNLRCNSLSASALLLAFEEQKAVGPRPRKTPPLPSLHANPRHQKPLHLCQRTRCGLAGAVLTAPHAPLTRRSSSHCSCFSLLLLSRQTGIAMVHRACEVAVGPSLGESSSSEPETLLYWHYLHD